MPKHTKKPAPKPRRWHIRWPIFAAVAAAALLVFIGTFTFAATMEERDSFCASCHTQPESTFYTRSQAGSPVDLATFHHTKSTKCIDCHSGAGTLGRLTAMMLGGRNAVVFYTGTAKQPAPLTFPIGNTNCLKCHAAVMNTGGGMNNHFHEFLPRWQAADPANAATCVECHSSHTTDGQADVAFLNQARTADICQSCHTALGAGN